MPWPELTEAQKRRFIQEAMNAYFSRDAEALRRLLERLLETLEKH